MTNKKRYLPSKRRWNRAKKTVASWKKGSIWKSYTKWEWHVIHWPAKLTRNQPKVQYPKKHQSQLQPWAKRYPHPLKKARSRNSDLPKRQRSKRSLATNASMQCSSVTFALRLPKSRSWLDVAICTVGPAFTLGWTSLERLWFVLSAKVGSQLRAWFRFTREKTTRTLGRKMQAPTSRGAPRVRGWRAKLTQIWDDREFSGAMARDSWWALAFSQPCFLLISRGMI